MQKVKSEVEAIEAAKRAGWSEQYSEGWAQQGGRAADAPAGFFNHLTGELSDADSWEGLILEILLAE